MKKLLFIPILLLLIGCGITKPIIQQSPEFEFEYSIPDFSTSKKVGDNKMNLPDANGVYTEYTLSEFQNFAPEVLEAYPELKSYQGVSADGKSIAIAISSNGMNATIFDNQKVTEIIPLGEKKYKSVPMIVGVRKPCETLSEVFMADDQIPTKKEYKSSSRIEGEIKNVPTAWIFDGEYSMAVAGPNPTKPKVLAAANATMTNVNFVYRRDFGLNLVLISKTPDLIFLDPVTDPFFKGSLNLQGQKYLTANVGNANYFVGGIISGTNIGSTAGCIGCVGMDDLSTPTNNLVTSTARMKGMMVVASPKPYGAFFDIDYVAHEGGHQFGAYHTMTSTTESHFATVEPGSGSTIMGYAGISGSYNVQAHSDPFFHPISIMQVQLNMGYKYPNLPTIKTGNRSPIVADLYNFKLPSNTPYFLKGNATDPDGDELHHWWVGTTSGTRATAFPNPTSLTGAKNLAELPTNVPIKYIPSLDQTRTGIFNTKWQAIPNLVGINEFGGIILGYRYFVADWKGENDFKNISISYSKIYRDFAVTSHSTAQTMTVGSSQTITWNVAGSDANGIDAKTVEILLIDKDNNETSITTTANDGSESITVPNAAGTNFRFMVRANFPSGGFYSLNKADLSIIKDTPPVVVVPPFVPDVDDEGNAPTDLQYTWINSSSVNLTWKSNPTFTAAKGYSIYLNPTCDNKELNPKDNGCEKYNGATTSTTYTIKNVKPGDVVGIKGKNAAGVRSDRATIILK